VRRSDIFHYTPESLDIGDVYLPSSSFRVNDYAPTVISIVSSVYQGIDLPAPAADNAADTCIWGNAVVG
jgi:hypothetical protein